MMEIPCVYRYHTFLDDKIIYVCKITSQVIPTNIEIKPVGDHKLSLIRNEKKNMHVNGLIFDDCNVTKVPQGLTRIFPNLQVLSIWNSTLKHVTRDDLAEYRNIERIGFCDNEIEYLPGNLFEGFRNLEEISFNGNKIELIEPNILAGLDKLKYVGFKDNPAYTKCFTEFTDYQSNATLEEVKDELFVRFYKDHKNVEDLLKFETENEALRNEIQKLNRENQYLRGIKNFLQSDELYKDFTISINDQDFRVHKVFVAAHSPTLAEILRNNLEIENLNLVDISVEIFESIFKFLYTDELPHENGTNFLHLFAAAGKLKIQELKNYAAGKIIDIIDEKNALDILKLSDKYEHDELRHNAFAKIKEAYPKIEFQDEWAMNVETVTKIIDGFKIMEEAIQKAKEFKKLTEKSKQSC